MYGYAFYFGTEIKLTYLRTRKKVIVYILYFSVYYINDRIQWDGDDIPLDGIPF